MIMDREENIISGKVALLIVVSIFIILFVIVIEG